MSSDNESTESFSTVSSRAIVESSTPSERSIARVHEEVKTKLKAMDDNAEPVTIAELSAQTRGLITSLFDLVNKSRKELKRRLDEVTSGHDLVVRAVLDPTDKEAFDTLICRRILDRGIRAIRDGIVYYLMLRKEQATLFSDTLTPDGGVDHAKFWRAMAETSVVHQAQNDEQERKKLEKQWNEQKRKQRHRSTKAPLALTQLQQLQAFHGVMLLLLTEENAKSMGCEVGRPHLEQLIAKIEHGLAGKRREKSQLSTIAFQSSRGSRGGGVFSSHVAARSPILSPTTAFARVAISPGVQGSGHGGRSNSMDGSTSLPDVFAWPVRSGSQSSAAEGAHLPSAASGAHSPTADIELSDVELKGEIDAITEEIEKDEKELQGRQEDLMGMDAGLKSLSALNHFIGRAVKVLARPTLVDAIIDKDRWLRCIGNRHAHPDVSSDRELEAMRRTLPEDVMTELHHALIMDPPAHIKAWQDPLTMPEILKE